MSDGRPFMALGSPGGSKIITAVLQTILNIADHKMTPLDAVSAPRVYAEAGKARVEARVRGAAVDLLRAQGFKVTATPQGYDTIQGRVQLVVVREDGTVCGASDPRRDGGIAAYSRR
jgi:gamma-glutamyltranspeptidase/glutathione hydrolase